MENLNGDLLLANLKRSEADRLSRDLLAGRTNLPDDLDVLLLDLVREREPLEQIVEPV